MIKLYSAAGIERPVRLCEATRKFAFDSLAGKYGDEAIKYDCVDIGHITEWDNMNECEKYDKLIDCIVRYAPVRIVSGELLSGAATLGGAISHNIPVKYNNEYVYGSVSHLTLDFERAVKLGVGALEKEVDTRLEDASLDTSQLSVLKSIKNSFLAMHIWHNRYLAATQFSCPDIYNRLLRVPFDTPRGFFEAVQSLWFCFAFTRLCGNWPGIGRLDVILGEYLESDLEKGVLTLDKAREILAHFFIKGCEWIQSDTPCGTGDAQHYQNIVLGGIDADGNEVTNTVTYLSLDVVEELAISDYPITVRISEKTPKKLIRRCAEVIRHGGGIVAIYNESLIIDSLVGFGYDLREARGFANDGCWEVQIPGKTYFSYSPFDVLPILLNDTLKLNSEQPAKFNSFEELYTAFKDNLKRFEDNQIYNLGLWRGKYENGTWIWNNNAPCSVVSMFEQGCVESGRQYWTGGAKYTVFSPHIGSAPDVGNSLYAIKKAVFDDKLISFDELTAVLKANWVGYENLKNTIRNKYTYYGNDNDEADAYTVGVLDYFAECVLSHKGEYPFLIPPGVSTFGRQIEWASNHYAVPFGFCAHDVLSGNASPTPGTDIDGATAEIKSYCKINLHNQVCGAALDVRLHPSCVRGDEGIVAICGLVEGFIKLGGFFMQIDTVSSETLKEAREHPELFKSLSVRVSGWNARFITLNKQWQDMVIARSENNI